MAAVGIVAVLFFVHLFGEFSCINASGIQLTPRRRVTIKRGSEIYVLCRSERKTSRFTWFVDGHMITSPYKVATDGRSGESVLLLTSHDFSGEFAYITCFVPPFTPKRVKVNLATASDVPAGFPVFSSKHQVIGAKPGDKVKLHCKVEGRSPKTITWFKFRTLIGQNANHSYVTPDGTLIISKAEKSDTGSYRCMVVNDVGAGLSPNPVKLVVNSELKTSNPINGGWCEPQRSENCDVSCIDGVQVVKRKCSCPRPVHGGTPCVGSSEVAVECNFAGCPRDVTLAGEISVGTMTNDDVTQGSCLHIGVVKNDESCSKDMCKTVSTMTTRDIKIYERNGKDNYLLYSMVLKDVIGSFEIGSLIQLGHCDEYRSANKILKKDSKTDSTIFSEFFSVQQNCTYIQLNMKANFEEKLQSFRGVLSLRPSLKAIPDHSCLHISIWYDVSCHGPFDCVPLMTTTSKSFRYQGNSILYNAIIPKWLDVGDYLVQATLQVDRCADNGDSKVGDFMTLKKQRIFITESSNDYEVDLTLDKRRPEGRSKGAQNATLPVLRTPSTEDVWVSGTVSLPGYSKYEIEARSCLTIKIREIYKCNESEGCRNPYVAERRALSLGYVAASQFSYDVKFSDVKGRKFVVSGILNLGWCKHFVKGKRRLKKGDYQTAESTVASLSEHQSQINIPLKMEEFPASKGKKEYLINGELKLESITPDMLKNSCLKVILATEKCLAGEECNKKPFKTEVFENLQFSPRQTIHFKIHYKKVSNINSVYLFVIFNNGWCSKGVEDWKSIQGADLIGDFAVKTEGDIGTLVLKKQKDIRFIEGPFARAEIGQDSIIVKGNIVLPLNYPSSQIEESSCLIVTVRDSRTCEKNKICPDSPIAKNIFKNIGITSKNTIAYELTVSPKLKPNIDYLFEAVLNKGWCSEGSTNRKWIQDGDLFNTVDARFENTDVTAVLQNIVLKVFRDYDKEKEKCILRCPKILDPVCASDNKTYNSLCDMETESCLRGSSLEMVHKGECEKCRRNCSRIIEPICARNGKTYDNICVMKREACFNNVYLTFRHNGICGSVTMRGEVRFPADGSIPQVPAGSCMIIRTRKSVYCDFPETCPDFELAEVVKRNITVPSNRRIPYEVIMNPRPKSSVYLIEVVLNRGWCSADSYNSQWIRNDDFFNYREQPFAVRGGEPIFKDVKVKKLTKLKEIEDKMPSGLIDPCKIYKCPFYAKCQVEFGEGRCTCPLACPATTKPVCGSDDKTYDSECSLQSESCILKKLLTVKYTGPCKDPTLTITGDVLVANIIPTVPEESCLIISIRKDAKCSNTKQNCDTKTIKRIVQKFVTIPPSNRIYFQMNLNPRPQAGNYIIHAVFNRGWCPKLFDTETIRIGDYSNDKGKKFEIPVSGSLQLDIVISAYINDVDRNSVLVKGEVTLDKNEQDIPNGSCLSISLHENLSCKRVENCSEQPLMRFYVKGLDKLPSDKIPYEATIKPRPKPGSYILSVVLNRGWCSEGSSEWIRDGDLFLNEGQKLEIGAAGSVYKDVSITRYYQGLPCPIKDGRKIADGEDVNNNGHGCQGCQCKNGTIVCKSVVCPVTKCDDGHFSIEDGDCCPVCIRNLQCKKKAKSYSIGQKHFNRKAGYCETCTCNVTGTFTCKRETCPAPSCRRAFLISSSCCPVCPSDIKCKDRQTAMLYKAGETWLGGKANSCSKCKCVVKPESSAIGYIECTKPSCPKLNCVQQVFPKGYCCPVCLKENANGPFKEEDVSYLKALIFNEVVSSEISCSDPATGAIFNEGERWRYRCMNYECSRSGIQSLPVKCPYLTCPKAYQVKKFGECCATCSPECLPKLLCTSEAIILVVPKTFLPHTKATELVFGNGDCVARGNSTHLVLKAGLHNCGTRQDSGNGMFFNYTNLAYTREDKNAVISRVRLVKIPVACTLPAQTASVMSRQFMKRNRPASVVNPIPEDTGPIEAYDIFMKVTDENGVEKAPGKAIEFDSPERVYIEIDGSGLKENNLTVRADYCYLTPTPGPKSEVNYTIIKDGCAVDPTVVFQETTGTGQRFSFRSLVFANPKMPGFYLHCDSVTCPVGDVKCRKGCRQRRALASQKDELKFIMRKKKTDHKRVMKLTLHVMVG
eukprot:gene16435-7846_t